MSTTKEKILLLLKSKKKLSARELRETIGVSESLIHRHLKKLLKEEKIEKRGSPPVVFYFIKSLNNTGIKSVIIKDNFLEIAADGSFLYGELGFQIWCEKRKLDITETVKNFEKTFQEIQKQKINHLIDATNKIKNSFTENFLEKLYYFDFYSYPIFGKTLLGKLVLYAKQNSDIALMKLISKKVFEVLSAFIQKEKFDLISFIPHSVPRKENFLQKTFSYFPFISGKKIFQKIFVDHPVAQKTLKSKKEREENAEKTLFLTKEIFPKKILLIDDACGSGATLQIAARKIKNKSPNSQIYAFCLVGSQKGFEVIAES